ncbi:WG repeat-containing protein [Pseudomonas gingeri]
MHKKNIRIAALSALVVALLAAGGSYYLVQSHDRPTIISGEEYGAEDMNEGDIDDLASLSLPEARKRLNYLITVMRSTLNAQAMIEGLDLQISPATGDTPPTELQYDPPFQPFATPEVEQALANLKDTPRVIQKIGTAGSLVRLDTSPLDDFWQRAAPPEQRLEEQYQIDRVYFRDGSEQAFADIVDPSETAALKESGRPSDAALTVNKPLDKLKVTVTYPSYPSVRKIVLDKDHPKASFGNGEQYQLSAISDKSVSLLLSPPKDTSLVVQAYGANPDKPLHNTGSSSHTLPSEEAKANLKKYYEELVTVRKHFDQYPDSKSLQQHLEQFVQALPDSKDSHSNVQAEYHFEDTPQRVTLYVLAPAVQRTASLELLNSTPVQSHYIAYDDKTRRAGFVDASGKWLIKPRFLRIEALSEPGIYSMVVSEKPVDDDTVELLSKYFYLLPGTDTLKQLPFEVIEQSLKDDLLLVERESNGPYGVYDLKKQQFTIPMKFVSPQVSGDIFIARLGDKTYEFQPRYGAYTLAGKEILPPRYSSATQHGDFIYTSSANRHLDEVFDLTGKKINPEGFNVIGTFEGEQPLLVQNLKSKQFAFINSRGERLPFNLPYDDVQPFSNGMAIVVKDSKRGAIDLQGKLQIPLAYKSIYTFQKNLAAAEPEQGFDGLVLIDRQNRVVKELGYFSQGKVSANSNDAQYTVYDPKNDAQRLVFDADGNQLESYTVE